MKKSLIIISVGLLNLIHGLFHIIQFIQSILLVAYSTKHSHGSEEDTWIDVVMHSPVFAIFWAIIGVVTLVIGIRDYRHHRKCSHEHKH